MFYDPNSFLVFTIPLRSNLDLKLQPVEQNNTVSVLGGTRLEGSELLVNVKGKSMRQWKKRSII